MKTWIARGTAVLLTGLPFAIGAQTPAQPTDDEISEEIVVTAQKRATTLQEVPFSVAAVTNEDIKRIRRHQHRGASRATFPACTSPTSAPAKARSPSAASAPARWCATSRREGIRRHLSRRIADLGGAVHARPRSLRPRSHRSAARPAGHAVRRGFKLRHRALHHRAARRSASSAARSDVGLRRSRPTANSARSVRGALNVPLGEKAAMRVGRLLQPSSPASSTRVYPDARRAKDVNDGIRTGGRIAFRFEPTENLTITPRIVYQKLETDGYPRVDVYNILGNTLHHHASRRSIRANAARSRRSARASTTNSRSGDLKMEFDFGNIGLTSRQHIHRSQR